MISKFENNKDGITLIALVLTIIVVLILAGVSIATLTGDNGIIVRASEAKRQKERLKEIEQEQLDNISGSRTNFIENFNKEKGCNEPKLTTGMTPVNYNWNNNKWEKCTTDNWDWNYDPQTTTTENGSGEGVAKWANAMTQDGSMWVWIPRYAYKISSGYHNKNNVGTGTIEIVFLVGTTNKDKEGITYSTTYDIDTATANGYMSDFVVHPVFGSNFNQGGWSEDITGFWCAKFEAGYAGTENANSEGGIDYSNVYDSNIVYTSNKASNLTSKRSNIYGSIKPNETLMKYPAFKPNIFSYVNISIGDAYQLSRHLNDNENPYGFSYNCSPHLIKNSEWGAVAYLTHSKYGRNGVEISINNLVIQRDNPKSGNNSFYVKTGYSSGSNPSANSIGINENTFDTKLGQLASTTGNIYGIFDISGAATEYVATCAEELNLEGYTSDGVTYKSTTEYFNECGNYYMQDDNKRLKTLLSIDYENATTNTNSGQMANYTTHNNIFGDAIWETSYANNNADLLGNRYEKKAWNEDVSLYPFGNNAFLVRGGRASNGKSAGLFYFFNHYGALDVYIGFRTCVTSPIYN